MRTEGATLYRALSIVVMGFWAYWIIGLALVIVAAPTVLSPSAIMARAGGSGLYHAFAAGGGTIIALLAVLAIGVLAPTVRYAWGRLALFIGVASIAFWPVAGAATYFLAQDPPRLARFLAQFGYDGDVLEIAGRIAGSGLVGAIGVGGLIGLMFGSVFLAIAYRLLGHKPAEQEKLSGAMAAQTPPVRDVPTRAVTPRDRWFAQRKDASPIVAALAIQKSDRKFLSWDRFDALAILNRLSAMMVMGMFAYMLVGLQISVLLAGVVEHGGAVYGFIGPLIAIAATLAIGFLAPTARIAWGRLSLMNGLAGFALPLSGFLFSALVGAQALRAGAAGGVGAQAGTALGVGVFGAMLTGFLAVIGFFAGVFFLVIAYFLLRRPRA